jgi:hypothetical protein
LAATPKNALFTFKGMSGKTYSVDAYVSDVANAMVTFDGGAGSGATSPDHYKLPENAVLIDFAMVTGTADTTKIRLTVNGKPLTHILRYTVYLTSLNNRPPLNIGFKAGSNFSAIQLA